MTEDTKELIKTSGNLIWQIIRLIGALTILVIAVKNLFA